jgi:7,8-dihydropterin-6-yl-methyl-4-(beta-D-ribofuranosyl)aminobenzene 5'-phosphate synthase
MAIKSLKLTTLADNMVYRAGLHGQWGLSILLDLEDNRGHPRKVLLDTGNDVEPLLHNIKELKVDLSDLDAVVLSHGHSDHTAATVEIMGTSGGCPVYAHPHCFLPRNNLSRKGKRTRAGVPEGQGVSQIEAAGGEVRLSGRPVEVVPGLWTTGQVPRVSDFEDVPAPREGARRLVEVEGSEVDDAILCDMALWADVEGLGPWVITGCAHSGPVNTLTHVRELGGFKDIYALVGGTHLVSRPDEYIGRTADALEGFGLRLLSPCHCTGFKASAMLWGRFMEAFVLNYCGRVIEAGETPRSPVL